MTRKVVETTICDRCGVEYRKGAHARTIGDLSYMILNRGSGSRDSNMADDLCSECTTEFLTWLRAGGRNL